MIGRFFGFLWTIARFFPTQAPGIRFGSALSVLLTFLVLVFFLIGLGLVLLGFDLEKVDVWLDRHNDWFELLGTILLKGFLVFVLAICTVIVVGSIIDRIYVPVTIKKNGRPSSEDRPGGCFLLIAIAIGYFCVVGVFFT